MSLPWKSREKEASEAAEQAEQRLKEEKSKWTEVHKKSAAIRSIREENHFVDTFRAILQ